MNLGAGWQSLQSLKSQKSKKQKWKTNNSSPYRKTIHIHLYILNFHFPVFTVFQCVLVLPWIWRHCNSLLNRHLYSWLLICLSRLWLGQLLFFLVHVSSWFSPCFIWRNPILIDPDWAMTCIMWQSVCDLCHVLLEGLPFLSFWGSYFWILFFCLPLCLPFNLTSKIYRM